MKKLLILSGLVASIFAAEQDTCVDVSFLEYDDPEIFSFLKEHKALEKREFSMGLSIPMDEGGSIEVKAIEDKNIGFLVLSLRQENALMPGQGPIKCCLAMKHVTHFTSIQSFLDNHKMTQQHKEKLLASIDKCDKRLKEFNKKLGDYTEWAEFGHLTASAHSKEVVLSDAYRKEIIKQAINLAKKQFPNLKLIRTYLKESETDQINAYGASGFEVSQHQYRWNCGFPDFQCIVYEKSL